MVKNINFLFYLKKPKQNTTSAYPIYLRITVDGQRAEISTGQMILVEKWSQPKGRVKGLSEEAKTINITLDNLLISAKKSYNNLNDKGKCISAATIKNHLLGIGQHEHTIIKCFENFVKEIELKVGSDYRPGTLKNYKVTLGHLKEYISKKFHVKDLPLKELNYKFITDFELMCKTAWECKKNSSSTKHIERIRKVIKITIANEWLEKDPFAAFKSKHEKSTIKFLTLSELQSIEDKQFSIERLERIKDVFLFSCYTGYAYADIEKFTPNDIAIGMDGLKWIYTERAKNESKSNVPLLPKALTIIEKYKNHPEILNKGKLLPVISNIKTNAYLKEIADICNIKKNLTFHMARHTFATTITLTNGVPIETVSAMLGHSSLKTTQIYAKVIDKKVSDDMQLLRSKFASLSKVIPLENTGS